MRKFFREGRFPPGRKLMEHGLGQELGMSRTPVREALALLANDGLLEPAKRGFVVPLLQKEDLARIFQMRRLLEPTAAAMAAQAASEEGSEDLQSALKDLRLAHGLGDPVSFLRAYIHSRAAWLGMVANPLLVQAIHLYADRVQYLSLQSFAPADEREMALNQFSALGDRIVAHDHKGAHACAQELLERAHEALGRLVGQDSRRFPAV